MNPKALFVILLIILVIYLGITQKAVCDPPYMLNGKECCIDSNRDAVCDIDQPEAFVPMTSETTTTLDPCIGLAGHEKTVCVFAREKRRYYDDCVDACNNASEVCRGACGTQNISKEKMACADACFEYYSLCYSDCGDAPVVSVSPTLPANQTERDITALNLTEVY